MILYGGSKPYPVSATPTAFAPQIGQFPPYEIKSKYSQQTKQKCAFHPVSARAKFTMPCLGDAVQRWLRHPEPSSWSLKSTIKEKLLYDTYLSEFFSLVRKERKGQKEEGIPLLNSFCRLAATGANTLPRPSNYSIVTATGSKRSSADSDSLLCHVGLWRTSRFKFGCGTGCKHSEIGFFAIQI